MSLKKTNGVELKKNEKILLHKSYTNDRKLRMIIVKDQWTAILANFVRKLVMFSNSVKDIYYLCNDRYWQGKLASLILLTNHMLKPTTLNDILTQKFLRFIISTRQMNS